MRKSQKPTSDKKKNIHRKRRLRARKIMRFLLFVLIMTGIIIFAQSSYFIVEKIDVQGNKKYTNSEIILKTGLVPGKNIFNMLGEKPKNLLAFRFQDLEQEVYQSMPYVKTVSIRPALPATIRIKVQERTPYAILDNKGQNLLIDREGYVLEVLDNKSEQLKSFFKITGMSYDGFKVGQAVNFKDNGSLTDLLAFCDVLSKSDRDSKTKLYKQVKIIDLSDIYGISVNFDNRIIVKFGDLEEADYQIGVFRYLLENKIDKKQEGTLDFTKGSNPYFVPKS